MSTELKEKLRTLDQVKENENALKMERDVLQTAVIAAQGKPITMFLT